MRARKLGPLIILLLIFTGCGGEWINDKGNFKRIFGFEKPAELQVIQSYYWKSAHWTVEYRYYVEMDAAAEFFNKLTAAQVMDSSTSEIAAQAPCLTSNHKPSWFLPKTLNEYQAWVPKANWTTECSGIERMVRFLSAICAYESQSAQPRLGL